MASGDVVGAILQSLPPAATRADPGIRAGGSTPGENWPVIRFDDSSDEYWDFLCALEGYGSGGLTIELPTATTSDDTGDFAWEVAIRRIQDDGEDIDTSHTYLYNSVTDAAPTVVGEVVYSQVTFTDGADMDSLADGERFMLRVRRDTGTTGITGDLELLWPAIIIRET